MSTTRAFSPVVLPERGTATVAKESWAGTETRVIDVAAWPDWQDRGFRLVSVQPVVEPEQPAPVPVNTPSRDLWPEAKISRMGGQAGIWAGKTALAREVLDDAANIVAAYIDRPPVPRANHMYSGALKPSGIRAVDYLDMAYLGEGLVLALTQITALQRRIAELEARLEMVESK